MLIAGTYIRKKKNNVAEHTKKGQEYLAAVFNCCICEQLESYSAMPCTGGFYQFMLCSDNTLCIHVAAELKHALFATPVLKYSSGISSSI